MVGDEIIAHGLTASLQRLADMSFNDINVADVVTPAVLSKGKKNAGEKPAKSINQGYQLFNYAKGIALCQGNKSCLLSLNTHNVIHAVNNLRAFGVVFETRKRKIPTLQRAQVSNVRTGAAAEVFPR